jgi:hypothetical protein
MHVLNTYVVHIITHLLAYHKSFLSGSVCFIDLEIRGQIKANIPMQTGFINVSERRRIFLIYHFGKYILVK